MTRKRVSEISALNVLFCLLVIFIHVVSYVLVLLPKRTVGYTMLMLPWRLSTFVVQGFVFLSGLKLFLNNSQRGYIKHLKTRFIGIVLPYTLCFVIYYVYFMICYDYKLDPVFIFKNYISGNLVYHLYFIPIILQFDLLLPLWKKIINRYSPLVIIPFAVIVTILCERYLPSIIGLAFPNFVFKFNDRFFLTYLSFWIIGCYAGKNYESFCRLIKENFSVIWKIFVACLVLTGILCCVAYNEIASVSSLNTVHYMYVLSAIVFFYALVLKIPRGVVENNKLILRIDKYSFYIYLYHVLILMLVTSLL